MPYDGISKLPKWAQAHIEELQAPRGEISFDLDKSGNVRENVISVRLDREDLSQLLISAAWNQISIRPISGNMIALKSVRS